MTTEQTQEEWEDEIISDSCFHQEGKKMQLKLRSIVRTARLKAVAQFDAMLAEDIENMKSQKIDIEKYRLDLIEFNRCNKSNRRLNIKEKRAWNDAIDKNLSILEARRLSLKK